LYVGITNDLKRRIHEHKNNTIDGFTKQYGGHTLVYFEQTSEVQSALAREKQLKHWNRAWKLELIEGGNPTWRDLYTDL
jgi:putative endonuclease